MTAENEAKKAVETFSIFNTNFTDPKTFVFSHNPSDILPTRLL